MRRSQQFRGSGPRRHPEGDQRPVAVAAEAGEQRVEQVVRDAARDPPGNFRPVKARALVPEGVHRVVMRMQPAPAAPGQRKRVHHRAGPQLAMQLIKAPQHRLAMGHRGRRISPARRRLARHRVRRTRRSPAAGRRRCRTSFPGGLDPAAEVTGLHPGGLRPRHVDRPGEPEPAQEIHAIRPQGRRRPPGRLKVAKVRRDRVHDDAVSVEEAVWLPRIPGHGQRTHRRNNQAGQVPGRTILFSHEPGR